MKNVPTGPTLPPSAVSNPGWILSGSPVLVPNPKGSDFTTGFEGSSPESVGPSPARRSAIRSAPRRTRGDAPNEPARAEVSAGETRACTRLALALRAAGAASAVRLGDTHRATDIIFEEAPRHAPLFTQTNGVGDARARRVANKS